MVANPRGGFQAAHLRHLHIAEHQPERLPPVACLSQAMQSCISAGLNRGFIPQRATVSPRMSRAFPHVPCVLEGSGFWCRLGPVSLQVACQICSRISFREAQVD